MTSTCTNYTFSLIKINEKDGNTEVINTRQTGEFLPTRLVSDFQPKAGNWLCLALFSGCPKSRLFFIIPSWIYIYGHSTLPKIGFVFSNWALSFGTHSTRFPANTGQQASGYATGVVGFRVSCFGFPAKGRLLALNWPCFFWAGKRENLYNHLSYRYLSSFCHFANWLCFFKLSSIFRRFLLFFTCFFQYFGFFFKLTTNKHE